MVDLKSNETCKIAKHPVLICWEIPKDSEFSYCYLYDFDCQKGSPLTTFTDEPCKMTSRGPMCIFSQLGGPVIQSLQRFEGVMLHHVYYPGIHTCCDGFIQIEHML